MRRYQNHVESPYLTPVLDFSNLWMVFLPWDLIYQKIKDVERIFRLKKVTRTDNFYTSYWYLHLDYINYDGTEFGMSTTTRIITKYDGYRKIEDLGAFPLRYHSKSDIIKERMLARGRKFVGLHGRHHCVYDGVAEVSLAQLEDDYLPLQPMRIGGRIMVDAKIFLLARPAEEVDLNDDSRKYSTETEDHLELTEDELLICNYRVMGFSLVDKKWCYFKVDLIEPVEYNKDAFENLLLQKDHKEMVRSLVTVHEKDRIGFDDVVKGKGHGMIFLLHGVPGVGKTLTAESVAEVAQRPLYTLSAGELGIDPVTVEKNLSEALRYATIWKAIVLMDEADVLLEQRTHNDLKRNSLVSVFLRVLEYYEGIMILTTNRVGSFDQAFKSRIHFTIKYPSLSTESCRNLWSTFLAKAASQVEPEWIQDPSTLDRLAEYELNGREIKNVVQTAYAYSVSTDVDLKVEHLEMAVRAMREFANDFAAERAKIEASRDGSGEDESNESHSKKRRLR